MSTQSRDTAPEIERIQIARLRACSFARKFAAIRSGAEALAYANLQAMDEPQSLCEQERARRFVARQYGPTLAADVVTALHQQPASAWALGRFDIGQVLRRVTEALTSLSRAYAVVGQLACALYGFPRPVFTVALLTDMAPEDLAAFMALVRPDILVGDARDALGTPGAAGAGVIAATAAPEGVHRVGRKRARMSSGRVEQEKCGWSSTPTPMPRWHLVHLSTLVGVEILPVELWPAFAHRTLQRARLLALGEDDGTWLVRVAPPEDVVLLDLLDLRRQVRRAGPGNDQWADGWDGDDDRWNDLRGVLKVQAPTLDLDLLDREAVQLAIREVLCHALADAGLPGLPGVLDPPEQLLGSLPGPTSGDGHSIRR